MKLLTIIGARPQFIKAATVSRAIKNAIGIEELIIHTGQHFDDNMSEVFFREMDIPMPNYKLAINSMSHGAMTGTMMKEIEPIMIAEKPDKVLVYGDTNTTLAGALSAAKLHIPVVHVEAGLRSFNMKMPEEINRILTDRISSTLFCPTTTAVANLKKEGFENFPCEIHQVGDVMYDAALFYFEKSKTLATIIDTLKIRNRKYVLATIHRAESTDVTENLIQIVNSLNEIAKEIEVVVPIHPRTRKILQNGNYSIHFTIVDPVGYFDMLQLLAHSALVITDSGGLQKEAFFFKKYCITVREQTEWAELVDNGVNALAGTDSKNIIFQFQQFNEKPFTSTALLYGTGNAAEKIVEIIK